MSSIASFRLAAAGLVLAAASSMPTVAHADLPSLPFPVPARPIPGWPQMPVLRLPDLVLDSFRNGARDDVVRPMVTLRNLGTGDATSDFVVEYRLLYIPAGHDLPTATLRESETFGPLRAGASRDVYLRGTARLRSGDTLLVEGTIDATSRVGESNERNNRFSFRFEMP